MVSDEDAGRPRIRKRVARDPTQKPADQAEKPTLIDTTALSGVRWGNLAQTTRASAGAEDGVRLRSGRYRAAGDVPGVVDRVYTPRCSPFPATLYFSVGGLSFPVLRVVEQELEFEPVSAGVRRVRHRHAVVRPSPVGSSTVSVVSRSCSAVHRCPVLQLLPVPAADTRELWVLLVVRVLTGAASSAMYLSQRRGDELQVDLNRVLRSSRFSSSSRSGGLSARW